MEVAEFGEQTSEQEVEGAQAHDSHDVRGVGEEGMAGDREDGGDGVEGEDYVCDFDGEEREEEDGGEATAIFDDEEFVLAQADGAEP